MSVLQLNYDKHFNQENWLEFYTFVYQENFDLIWN